MNIRDSDDCNTADMLDTGGVSALWPGSSSDDIIRRQLAALLLEDPDHRLRVAHLEPLLQLRVDATCSSGRLQALLTDPDNARIFPVDFSNTRVADWRSRVVYLDTRQLAAEVASAKQHQHAATGLSSGRTSCEPPSSHHSHLAGANGSGARGADAPAGDLSGSAYLLQQQAASLAAGNLGGLQDCRPSLSGSLGQQPMMLETIFGASPGFGGQQGRGGQPDRSEQPAAGRAGGGGAGSYGTAGVGSAGAGDARPAGVPGLFGGSFEVPHAIASCWAPSSSCGSGTGSDRQAPPQHQVGRPHHHHHHHGPAALDAHDACGGSSTASGSSSRSVGTAANRAAAAAAASRLRKASSGPHAGDCAPGGGGQQQQLPAVCSSGALSGLDGSTPKSCGHADDASASSPVNSSACEDEVEYTEAQLVFGLPGVAGGAGGAGGNGGDATPAASATPGTARTRDGDGAEGGGVGESAGDAAGDAPPLHGVDWSKVAALQHQQHQQHAAGSWQAALGRAQGQGTLLFGLDDRHDDPVSARGVGGGMAGGGGGGQGFGLGLASLSAAAASGALAARRLMMDPQSHHQADLGGQGFLGSSVGLGYRGGGGGAAAAGSAPVDTTGLLFMPGGSMDSLMGAGGAMAAYGASAGMGTGLAGFHPGIGGAAAAATAAELAESVLLDAECGMGPQQAAQQQGAPGYGAHISSSYSSAGLLSERSNSGCWGASPAAHGYALAAAQQQQQRQQQQQQAAGEAAGDISLRSDQLKELVGRAAAAGGGGGGGVMPGKPEAGGVATADNKAAGAGAGNPSAPGAAPRLTGWASIAAREPKAAAPLTPRSAAAAARDAHAGGARQQQQQQQLAAGPGAAAGGGGKAGDAGKALHKLPVRVRSEVYGLVAQYAGVLKADDFDEGVVHQLNAKRSEEEAVAAVRHVAHYDLANIQHMAAYLNHLVKHYNHNAAAAAAAAGGDGSSAVVAGGGQPPAASPSPSAAARAATGAAGAAGNGGQLLAAQGCSLGSTLGGRGGGGAGAGAASGAAAAAAAGSLGAYGGQIRLASVPVSTKSMLQKLPLKVFRQLEQLVAGCAFLEWRHFDAGVVKVLAQLSKLCEADVFEELELLAATDLSNVEYMPAYLNKRLNNKLWSRRKAMGEVPSG